MLELSLCASYLLSEVKKIKNNSPEGISIQKDTCDLPLTLYFLELDLMATSSQKGGQESKCWAFSASLRKVGKEKRQHR